MSKAETSDKRARGKQTIRDVHGHKPRSAERDFWVFAGGVGSLIYVLMTMVPN